MNDILTVLAFIGVPALGAGLLVLHNKLKAAKNHAAMTVSTCGVVAHPGGTMDAASWFIGPRLEVNLPGWGNKSPGMPEHPTPHPDGFEIDFPTDAMSKVDYVTFRHGPLTGKTLMRLKYRLEMADGVEVLAVPEQDNGKYTARITPYFQKEGDDWSTVGEYEDDRWYFDQDNDLHYLLSGEHEIVAPLDHGWGATQNSTMGTDPAGFKDAIDHACCVGFVFGGNDVGIGHGARATGPAKLVITNFSVE